MKTEKYGISYIWSLLGVCYKNDDDFRMSHRSEIDDIR